MKRATDMAGGDPAQCVQGSGFCQKHWSKIVLEEWVKNTEMGS